MEDLEVRILDKEKQPIDLTEFPDTDSDYQQLFSLGELKIRNRHVHTVCHCVKTARFTHAVGHETQICCLIRANAIAIPCFVTC